MLVLELVRGQTLKHYADGLSSGLPRHRLPLTNQEEVSCLQIMEGVTQAIAYLHARQPAIIHADLKPSNIMVQAYESGPHVKLLDFGLSRVISHAAKIDGGTQGFMAPEVVRGWWSTVVTPPLNMRCPNRHLKGLKSPARYMQREEEGVRFRQISGAVHAERGRGGAVSSSARSQTVPFALCSPNQQVKLDGTCQASPAVDILLAGREDTLVSRCFHSFLGERVSVVLPRIP